MIRHIVADDILIPRVFISAWAPALSTMSCPRATDPRSGAHLFKFEIQLGRKCREHHASAATLVRAVRSASRANKKTACQVRGSCLDEIPGKNEDLLISLAVAMGGYDRSRVQPRQHDHRAGPARLDGRSASIRRGSRAGTTATNSSKLYGHTYHVSGLSIAVSLWVSEMACKAVPQERQCEGIGSNLHYFVACRKPTYVVRWFSSSPVWFVSG